MSYIERRVKQAFDAMRDEDDAMKEAAKKLQPHMGNVDTSSFDSPEELFEHFFKQIGVDVSDVDPSAYPAMVRMLSGSQVQSMQNRASDRRIASDSALGGKSGDAFFARWPEAKPQSRSGR